MKLKQDLFAGEEEGRLDDALIGQLARAKLEKHGEKLKSEGLPWVEVHPKLDYETRARFIRVRTIYRGTTDEGSLQLMRLRSRSRRCETSRTEKTTREGEAAETKREEAHEALDNLRETVAVHDRDQRAIAGALISIGHDGRIDVERDMLKGRRCAAPGPGAQGKR